METTTENRRVITFLHIPKCGGSTVTDFLLRNFLGDLKHSHGILNDYQYTSEQVERIISHYPSVKCITGHKFSLDLPWEMEGVDLTAFTLVRDPVKRFISHYFYHRNHTDHVPETKKYNLSDYTQWALADGNQPAYINGQTKFLAQNDMSLIREKCSQGKFLLFPLSRLEESLRVLVSKHPHFFRSMKVLTKNVSQKNEDMQDSTLDQIRNYVSQDIELVQYAEQYLDDQPKEIPLELLKTSALAKAVNQMSIFSGSTQGLLTNVYKKLI